MTAAESTTVVKDKNDEKIQPETTDQKAPVSETETTESKATEAAELEPVKEDPDPAIEATMHLVQGKRHMLVQDYYSAVDSFQRACQLLSAKYGDDASENAEALLQYGKALLELHRKQTGPLQAIDEGEDENEEDSSEEEAEEEDEEGDGDKEKQQEEGSSTSETKKDEPTAEGDPAEAKSGESSPKDEEDLEKPEPALQDPKLDDPKPVADEQDQTVPTIAVEDASSDLQIAFEVLDLAKSIFKRDAEKTPELYLKAADCLQTLGEVGLESDNYQQAIDDFEACLRIQQEMLPTDSRATAETNYHLGLSYSFVAKYDTSSAYFADSLKILNLRLENLKKQIEEGKKKGEFEGNLSDDPVWIAQREVEDIESFLPEIASKLEDSKEMQKERAEGPKEQVISQMLDRTPESSPVKKESKVNVLGSNMIKRKRPLEGGESSAQAEKKPKET